MEVVNSIDFRELMRFFGDDYIMNDTEVDIHPIEPHITEDVDVEDLSKATYESEKINEDDGNGECDKDKVNDESIVGKVFDTTDDVYNFYNDYAFIHGFGIRIHTTFKNKGTNEPYRKILVCDKEGFKREDGDTSSGHEKKRRREVRIGCKAMLRISKRKDGKWIVDLFDETHNHELSITPTKLYKKCLKDLGRLSTIFPSSRFGCGLVGYRR
uniref:FAR1 domain-containing protein n=1 Tax=Lactuca sativa TaxID=4236 RepID=A0A9R1VLJ8_LACSA|nr:hypothetical protein LSAT_V11C500257710 [Lactuca sativa]